MFPNTVKEKLLLQIINMNYAQASPFPADRKVKKKNQCSKVFIVYSCGDETKGRGWGDSRADGIWISLHWATLGNANATGPLNFKAVEMHFTMPVVENMLGDCGIKTVTI